MAYELKHEGFKLKDVLQRVDIPESTYHYQVKQLSKEDQDLEWKYLITELFNKHEGRYGYRRISSSLKNLGYEINHKKVQRIMKELGLKCVKFIRKSRYSSYKGKVGKVAKNKLNRRFHTSIPLQKLVTDITEFKCSNDEKLYLSPILDLYNGEIISYSISKRPTLDLVMNSLNKALEIVKHQGTFRTTIHSDQGWHYQHKTWVSTLKSNRVIQSMSRKATCADNASMENFFGILKQEMYYGEKQLPYQLLKEKIEHYIYYFNNDRIKLSLSGLSPVQYREKLELSKTA